MGHFNQQYIYLYLQPAGVKGQTNIKLCSSDEGGTDGKDLSVMNTYVCVAPPIIVGEWSMAAVLW